MASPLPNISALTYALPTTVGGTARITVTLDDVPGPTITGGVFLGTTPTGTPLAQGTNDGAPTIEIPIDPALLDPAFTYSVALTISQSPNWGAPTILIFQQPVLTAIEVLGEAVEVRWTVPQTSNITAVDASIYDTVSATTLVSVVTPSLVVTLFPPQPVDPDGNYVIRLVGQNGVAAGPLVQSTESLILTSPTIASTVYDTASITINATDSTPPDPIYAQLLAGGVVVDEVAGDGTTATIALDAPLDAASRWQVVLLYRSTIAAGPLGVTVVLPLVPPELVSASYDGGTFNVSWTLPANATGASVTIAEIGGANVGTAEVLYGTSTSIAATVDANKSYEVRLAPYAGTARGLFGAATPLIVARPVLGTAVSDGERVVVTMSGLSAPATATVLQLTSGGSVVATASAGLTAGRFPQAALPSLAVTAYATGPKVSGPASSAPIALVTEAPVIASVSVANNSATVSWAFSSPSTSYQFSLVNGRAGTSLGSAGASPATVALPARVDPGAGIVVRAVSGSATGPASAAVPVIASALTVAAPQYDGSTLYVDWSAATDAGLLGYTVAILDSQSATVASTNTTATSVSFDVELTPGAQYTINVNAYGAGTTGPVATQTFSVPPATTLTFVTYNAGTLYVDWTVLTADMVTGYRVDVFLGFGLALSATIEGQDSNRAEIAAALEPGSEASVTVTALSHGVDGPMSVPLEVMTVLPTLTNVFYDGTTLSAAWTTQGGSAPTYVLAVLQGASPIKTQVFTDTNGSFPIDLSGSGYTVAVWASGASTYGPSSAAVDPQSGAIGYFFSPDAANLPYVFRSTYRPPLSPALQASDVTVYLPNVFTGTPPGTSSGQTTFTLSTVTGGGQIQYKITVAAGVAWSFTAASRTTLRGDYLKFLAWLEGSLLPGAAPYIGRALSLAMPLLFGETLLYRYGFNPASRYVDLQPGMKLRVDSESYQFTSTGDNEGFVTTASATYDVTQSPIAAGAVNVAWDAFLTQLVNVTVDAGGGGMGGIIDLYGTGLTKPYYRLIYPSAFMPADSEGSGDVTRNVALLGATTIAILEDATTKYLTNKALPSGAAVSFFRGRAVVLPRIVVVVDGSAVEVPVGTTLRQLIGSWANLPFAESLQLTGISVERSTAGVVDSVAQVATSLSIAQTNVVDFSNQTVVRYPNGADWFDLPLLGGDRIALGGRS
jgi:hypothetical protein